MGDAGPVVRRRAAPTRPLQGPLLREGRPPSGGTLLAALLVLAALPGTAAAQELPPGVTAETVERGRQLYLGDGFCHTCHGRDGRGLPDLGAGLTGGDWNYSDGSLEGLEEVIQEGVLAETSSTGIPMPPRGGAGLSPEEVRALAAYVWSLSRNGPGGVP